MRITSFSSFIGLVSLTVAPVTAWAEHPISLWLRAPGLYGQAGSEPAKLNPKTVDLDTLPQTEGARGDVQYGGNAYYRGVALADVVQKYEPPMGADLALLHFHNGMVVPLPFREARTMARLAPLIAVSRKSREDAPYVAEFPPVNKSVEGYADIRQVSFAGNKLVVSDRWHPDLKEGASANFSPWTSTGSLTGIEFVEGSAYYRQFVPSPEHRPGLIVFQQTCQFCHGVRKVGASYGWDYASPLPLHTYRSDANKLYMHIAFRVEYKQTWQMMPALKHVTEAEAGLLWQWMRAVSSAPLTRYSPTKY